jgi:hypothetical protein
MWGMELQELRGIGKERARRHRVMSALGQKQTLRFASSMSALRSKDRHSPIFPCQLSANSRHRARECVLNCQLGPTTNSDQPQMETVLLYAVH